MRQFCPAFGLTLVLPGQHVYPGGTSCQHMVYRWFNGDDLTPVYPQFLRPFISRDPYAFHFRFDLTMTVCQHTATGPVPEILGTGHGADHAGGMEDALPAHTAAEDRLLGKFFQG